MDGRSRADVGEFRPADRAGLKRADWSGHLLRVVAIRPQVPACGDRVPGIELVRGQPGWNAGPRAPARAAALRVLCGPHRGHSGSGGADVRAWLERVAAPGDGDGHADRVPGAVERKLPGHLYVEVL